MKQVLVIDGNYYDVSTRLQLHNICVAVLRERLNEDWYDMNIPENFNSTTQFDDYCLQTLGFSEACVLAMPKGDIKEGALKQLEIAKTDFRCATVEIEFVEKVRYIINLKANANSDVVLQDRAWRLLKSRSDKEYESEGVELAEVKDKYEDYREEEDEN